MRKQNLNWRKIYLFAVLCSCLTLCVSTSRAQSTYFIDGYHGGIWGHYPYKYSSFIAQQMDSFPNWRLNLEIEPVTWDSIQKIDPQGYAKISQWLNDPAAQRIEYINPDYGQSYLFNISPESIIRQFKYGMQELKKHFPNITFTTYSSEEPCFTNALPGILTSYGIKYASLKNPNTCWGGYVRAHGGALVNWVGPDGTKILTVPRYQSEKLAENSTWQTDAWNNNQRYIQDALAYGIKQPVGMTIQDAGWRNGPWLGKHSTSTYTTWRNYFENIVDKTNVPDWKLSQEDIQVSLVWGGQILQRVAEAVRKTENKMVNTESITALRYLYDNRDWPQAPLDKAWKDLLLSQHHDCWIVPNNRKYGKNWQQYVAQWTNESLAICDSILENSSTVANKTSQQNNQKYFIQVYNSTGQIRTDIVAYKLPEALANQTLSVLDQKGKAISSQQAGEMLYINATIPALGYCSYQLRVAKTNISKTKNENIISQRPDGNYLLQTDRYKILIDKNKGGTIKSLVLKNAAKHEFVAEGNQGLNELRGFFYKEGVFHSSTETPATIKVVANGPLFAELQINGMIAGQPFIQNIKVTKTGKLINGSLHIDWKQNIGIGQYDESHSYRNENLQKAFYNTAYKLLTLFPVAINKGQIYKDAPFDIYKSTLTNTFFTRWDSIKNDIMLHWVELTQQDNKYGFAIFSDQTTSYGHGDKMPLGLTTQYSGKGLFGADYNLNGPTDIHYAFYPHEGDWKEAKVNVASEEYNHPLVTTLLEQPFLAKKDWVKSFLDLGNSGWTLTSFYVDNGDIIIRLFNAQGNNVPHTITLDGHASQALKVQLNGEVIQKLPLNKNGSQFSLSIPTLGFRTIRLIGLKKS